MKTVEQDVPLKLFGEWFEEAHKIEPINPEAMALATATADGRPSARMVLLKDWGPEGFVFYTNFESRKGGELQANGRAALLFYWRKLARQIRIEGPVEAVSEAEAEAYFASRPRDTQIGAWASQQSRPMEGRWVFEKEIARFAAKYMVGKVPRPPQWSGFRVIAEEFEFWRERRFRLHERRLYKRQPDGGWTLEILFP
ncbi:MAG: pyridoxamine 5'-phosphate oxidase [Proteobacteria bacterium]|nr:pyridoxamine 5'-phosphate oxidase [Pseudomonadota bacterium]